MTTAPRDGERNRPSTGEGPTPGKVDPPAPADDGTATWGGEGGAGDYRGGPVTSRPPDDRKDGKDGKDGKPRQP
jgi:hypothetical protein